MNREVDTGELKRRMGNKGEINNRADRDFFYPKRVCSLK